MYRYRDNSGSTSGSLDRLEHIDKLGKLSVIRGYTYKGKYGFNSAVLIKGENGSARYSGFSWGYSGEGPRGLEKLLRLLNINQDEIKRVLDCPWDGWSKKEISWEIKLGA